jgi:hypothetical protein
MKQRSTKLQVFQSSAAGSLRCPVTHPFLSKSGAIFEPQKWIWPTPHFDIRNSLFDILRFKSSFSKLLCFIFTVTDLLILRSWWHGCPGTHSAAVGRNQIELSTRDALSGHFYM